MEEVTAYRIITSYSPESLETVITSFIELGWIPLGGVTFSYIPKEDDPNIGFHQVIVKYS